MYSWIFRNRDSLARVYGVDAGQREAREKSASTRPRERARRPALRDLRVHTLKPIRRRAA